jgi:hypothetical protein
MEESVIHPMLIIAGVLGGVHADCSRFDLARAKTSCFVAGPVRTESRGPIRITRRARRHIKTCSSKKTGYRRSQIEKFLLSLRQLL